MTEWTLIGPFPRNTPPDAHRSVGDRLRPRMPGLWGPSHDMDATPGQSGDRAHPPRRSQGTAAATAARGRLRSDGIAGTSWLSRTPKWSPSRIDPR